MTRLAVFSLCIIGASTALCLAQPVPATGPIQRPVTSPYLGLLSNTGSAGLNYLALVRPQQQLQQQLGQLQQQNVAASNAYDQALNQDLNTLASILAPTGNVAVFNNTGNYFNRYGASFSSGGGGGRSLGGGSSFNRGSFGSAGGASRSGLGGAGRSTGGAGLGGFGGGAGLGGGVRR